ncbi:MAG: S1 RNA-binding domain-containing protein [Chloroflexi bacterium]|nr:S1 RNA-binding domain-containing protein [Chloroflexota bacterium]
MVTPEDYRLAPEDGSQMAQLLAEQEDWLPSLRRGEAVEGTVISIDQEGVLVNIGAKSEGMIPLRELRTLEANGVMDLKPGDSIVAMIVREESGVFMLSYDRAQAERSWRQLEKEQETGAVLQGEVVGHNRGGLLVEVLGLQGFVPLSQLSPEHRSLVSGDGEDQTSALGTLAGEIVAVKVIEVNRRRQRAILSERVAAQEMRDEKRAVLLNELKEGTTRRGRVTGVQDFGAFVDLGGADGLIHISELSWEPVSSPSEVVQPGQEIDVYILKVDTETRRISLSLRRTKDDPWQVAVGQFSEGQIVQGTVTRLAAFGAFARLDGNVEGLIHISELADRHIRHPREVVTEGETYTLKILRIEPERRRLGLSLKQTEGAFGASAIQFAIEDGDQESE